MENIEEIKYRYLSGTASQEERQAVNNWCSSATPEERADWEVDMLVFAREHARRKANLLALSQTEGWTPQRPPQMTLHYARVWMAAAVVLLAVGIWWVVRSPMSEFDRQLGARLEVIYPAPVQTMGEAEVQGLWSAAGMAYREKRFDEAMKLYDQLAQNQTERSSEAMFYAGLSALYAEAYSDAVQRLNAVPNGPHREAAGWYGALALLKLGRKQEAKALLISLENTPREDAAREMLKWCE